MLLRAKENGSVDCECNTATLYFDDNTGFFCSQDWHFQIESLIDFLDRKDSLYPDSLPVISGVVDSLNNLTTQSISYHELLEISSAESGNSLN